MAKIVPVTIALAFSSRCSAFLGLQSGNPGGAARIITDICYWFFVPVRAHFRIGCWCSAPPFSSHHEPTN